MKQCKTVADCHEFATMDTYGDDEAEAGWLACIEEVFCKFKYAKILGSC